LLTVDNPLLFIMRHQHAPAYDQREWGRGFSALRLPAQGQLLLENRTLYKLAHELRWRQKFGPGQLIDLRAQSAG
jgi:isopentenyldiphosphate isomerase